MKIEVTYELLLRIVAQITNSDYFDLVFTGSRRYEFGEKLFVNEIIKEDNHQDIDVVFPVNDINRSFPWAFNISGYGDTVITESFISHDQFKLDPDYPTSTISGYIGIFGFRVNLIGRPKDDVENWKFATKVMSELWDDSFKLKFDREYRVKIFKMLRKAED